MAKKISSNNARKESPSNKYHEKNPGRGQGSNNAGGKWKNDQGNGMAGGGKSKGNEWMSGSGKQKEDQWTPEASNTDQAPWIPELSDSPSSIFSRLKNACLPKALMLLLPFIAVGAYLLFAS